MSGQTDYGKGDLPRPIEHRQKYDAVMEKLFGPTKLNIWPRNEDGELIELCPHCRGKGYLEDIGLEGKPIKTKCMFCEKGFIKSNV